MPQSFQLLSHGVGSRKLLINPLELSQCNLIHQVPFAMTVAIEKVQTKYHDPVGIRKAVVYNGVIWVTLGQTQ